MKKYLIILLLFILPNLFWQYFAFLLDVNRIFINIDYIVIIALILFNKKNIFIFIFLIISFFDFINIFSQIFPFIRLYDLIYLIKFVMYMSPINFIFIFIFIILSLLYIFACFNKINQNSNLEFVVFINFLLTFWIIQNIFVDEENSRIWSMQNNRVISSQIVNAYNVRTEGFVKSFSGEGNAFNSKVVDSASKEIFLNPDKYKKILLIVNESWGVTQPEIQNKLLSKLIENKSIIDLKQGILKVNGFTIDGEVRELCRKTLSHFNLKDQQKGFENCLPNLLKSKGYYTVAMHGATGSMYDRKYWYPKAGFDNLIFREALPRLHSRCFSFPGFCDRDLQSQIPHIFSKHNKTFFYWLSLNTHVNYDLRDLENDDFDCVKYKLNSKMSSCRNLKLQKQFFNSLAKLVQEPALKGTYVMIVGDHAPPIYDESRNVFNEGEVSSLGFYVK